jgi:hypothetical protein
MTGNLTRVYEEIANSMETTSWSSDWHYAITLADNMVGNHTVAYHQNEISCELHWRNSDFTSLRLLRLTFGIGFESSCSDVNERSVKDNAVIGV